MDSLDKSNKTSAIGLNATAPTDTTKDEKKDPDDISGGSISQSIYDNPVEQMIAMRQKMNSVTNDTADLLTNHTLEDDHIKV